jgi:N-acetylmuramidase
LLGVPTATLKAVVAVESAGFGFFNPEHPKILFEAHWFGQLTNHKFDRSHPNISSSVWNRSLYLGGLAEYSRLEKAMALDPGAVIQSASWGLFQVMGFHYRLGYSSVEEFYNAMHSSEWKQLEIAIAFIKNKGLDRHLRNKSWAAFAYGYNGNGYRANQYDRKLKEAYDRTD